MFPFGRRLIRRPLIQTRADAFRTLLTDAMPIYYHGGKAGLLIGDAIVPAPAHIEDGCPICEAKRVGRACSVGAYRAWLRRLGAAGEPILLKLASLSDFEVIDPPRAKTDAVYITTDVDYALWYAARSRGDLYTVKPEGALTPSREDHFPTFTVASARVAGVIQRGVYLTRADRRRIERKWKKADERVERGRRQQEARA